MILKCSCSHQYQDKKYGKFLRVHNKMKKDDRQQMYRCTVCKKVRGDK